MRNRHTLDDPMLTELLESMNGLSTLHETPFFAAYPEHGRLDAMYDKKTGEEPPLKKVRKADGRELDKMAEHKLGEDITYRETRKRGLMMVRSR